MRIALAFVLIFASLAAAQSSDSSALINQQLDKPVTFDLSSAPLPQVLQSVETQTGVPLRAGDDVYDALPFGRQTPISAKITNLPLRAALQAITSKLGLEFALEGEVVRLRPQPALKRLGRRATLQEVASLDLLSTTALASANRQVSVSALIEQIDSALSRVTRPAVVIEFRAGELDTKQSLTLPRDLKLLEALDLLHSTTRFTWYPWGDSVVILPKTDAVKMVLERPLNVRYEGQEVSQVLLDLGRRTGITFMIEPGALQTVPMEFFEVNLTVDETPVRQILETLSGATGLGYVAVDEGVYIWSDSPTPATPRSTRRGGSPLISIDLGNGVQALVSEDQLPADVVERIRQRTQAALKTLTPATQPAN